MKQIFSYLFIIIVGIILYFVLKPDPPEPPRVKVKTEFKKVIDSISSAIIKEPRIMYIDTTGPQPYPIQPDKIIIYRDTIIYIDTTGAKKKPIEAREYPATIQSKNATAQLSILTTGKLLNVTGTIEHTEQIKTIETTKWDTKNTLYLYAQTSVLPQLKNYQIGIDYTIRNKLIIGTNIGYDPVNNAGSLNLKFGVTLLQKKR